MHPDWTKFVTNPWVLFTLAVLGALGAGDIAFRLYRAAPKWWKNLKGWYFTHAKDSEFYFKFREFGYRLDAAGTQFQHVRRETVRAVKPLKEIPFSYRWTGEGTVTVQIIPSDLKIIDVPRALGDNYTRKKIVLNTALAKGQEFSYTLVMNCERKGHAPETFLASKSSHRVDEVLLRVVFDETKKPTQVYYLKRNLDGGEQERAPLEQADFLNCEYSKRVYFPEPHLEHRIEWQ